MDAEHDRPEPLFRFRDFTDILTTAWPFQPVTIFLYLAVTMIPTTASELSRLAEPSLVVAMGISALSVIVIGALLFIAKAVIPTRLLTSLPIVLVVLLCAGALRAIIVSGFMDLTDLEAYSHLTSRLFVATLSITPVLALVSLVVSRIVLSRERAASTQIEISAIESQRDLILNDITESDSQLLHRVDSTLRPAVESLSTQIIDDPDSRRSIATALHSLANDVIRPLSHSLASTSAPGSTPRVPLARDTIAPRVPTFQEQVSPTFVGLVVFMGSGTVLLENLPFANAAAASIVSGAVAFAAVRILVSLVRDARWPVLGVTAVNSGVLALSWMPAHFFNQAFLFPDEFVFGAWVTSFVAMPVVGLLYQLIILGSYSGRNQLARLEDTRRNMAFQLSEARRRAWLRQRHLTHALHSSVQSRVLAESRLVGAGSGKLNPAEQQRSLETLGMVLDTIDDDPKATINALEGINDMVAFWSGMCDVSLAVEPDLLSTVDAETAESVMIVATEVITNAIRHGSATSMSIDIHRDSPDAIRIIATNNGRSVGSRHRPGLGMALYDELCAEWQILPGKPVTVVALVAARGNKSHHTTFETIGSRRRAP
jgi:signal transduction histidine kinase